MAHSNPPGLPAELSRPDAQLIVDALNLRLHTQERKFPVSEIAEGAVGPTQIENEAITTAKLHAEAVTAGKIEAGTITAAQLHANAVTAEKIEAGAVTTAKIEAKAVTAEKIKVTELSSITANLGSIESGSITGATIKTAGSGARVELTSSGIKGLNVSGTTKFNFDTATGILTATAVISAEEGSTIPTKVLSGQIKETQIEEGAVNTPQLFANAVTTAKLASKAVTTEKLEAKAVTAEKLKVEELSAISANMGEITSGVIKGGTFETTTEGTKITGGGGIALYTKEGGGTASEITLFKAGTSTRVGAITASPGATQVAVNSEALSIGEGESLNTLGAFLSEKVQFAKIFVKASPSVRQVRLQVDEETPTLMDGTGKSSFLQLTETAKRKVAFGHATVTWGVKGLSSSEKEVSHGLGTTPEAVLLTPRAKTSGGVGTLFAWLTAAPTAAVFKFAATNPTTEIAASSTLDVSWLAIG